MTDQDARRAEEMARQRLQTAASGLSFRLVVAGVRREDDWLHVVVEPDRQGVSVEDYVGILARIEEQIKDELDVNVLLVPAVAAD